MKFPNRYIARITVEALTPLIIGGDDLLYDQDNPIDKDFNNLPYIPGTAIAGFLRSKFHKDDFFGDDKHKNSDKPKGSNIIVSDAYLLNYQQKVYQTPVPISVIKKDELLKHYIHLPLRQHTKINHLGATDTDKGSKFDQEFVYKGSRFKFEINLETKDDANTFWEQLLKKLLENSMYLGSGKYNNFGELKVVEINAKSFDFIKLKELDDYLNISTNLNYDKGLIKLELQEPDKQEQIKIKLDGSNSFFHFGSGLADDEVDDTNYKEKVIEGWKNNKPAPVDNFVIPGTSIKGALAHRTAFHYNSLNQNTIESLSKKTLVSENTKQELSTIIQKELPNDKETLEKELKQAKNYLAKLEEPTLNIDEIYKNHLAENNEAVATLFGTAKNTKENKEGQKGKLIIKDIYLDENKTPQIIFMHNKIDRFTQGTIDAALFGEKTLQLNEVHLIISGDKDYIKAIDTTKEEHIKEIPFEDKEKLKKIIESFNLALEDLKNGLLPLGGKTSKGHGIFIEKIDEK